ncbi:MAG: hypothetical protein ACI8V5_004429 [Limisphaerales bacterium]|jgi:hypothetical protein
MSEWIVIFYNSFWDVPRDFVVRFGENAYYFDSPFDDDLDDYTPDFFVCRIPVELMKPPITRWSEFKELGERLPDVPVSEVRFHSEPIPGQTNPPVSLRFVHESLLEILEGDRA